MSMENSMIVGEFSVFSPSQKKELERKRREQEAREAEEAARKAEEMRKKSEAAQRAAAAKKMAAEKMRQQLTQKMQNAENAKSSKITILIIAGIAATIFLIWSFIKLYNWFDGFIIFFLFGGIMWIGAIIGVWAFVKESIEDAINKCKSEIRYLKGK